jgi:NAD(P)-dependent dehydrogenase (short-subunit alcohol dehydrogenase family)
MPQEIVTTALYLAADASSYVTGAAVKVDGGGWGMGALSGRTDG